MFRFIFRHKQYCIAYTIIAENKESAEMELKNAWNEIAEKGWDIPHPSTFELIEQIIL
jgi:hypothetical protein